MSIVIALTMGIQTHWYCISHRIHGAGIYANIYHQYTPFMLAYIPYMDPMGIYIYIYVTFYECGLMTVYS